MSNGALSAAALNISERTLTALQQAGQIFPIPGVAIAAGVALEILRLAQTVKSNKDAFIAIGRDSCVIVETVVQRVQVGPGGQLLSDPSMLREDADLLLADMRYIQKCVKKVKKRSVMGRIFNHQVDQDTIQECKERLTHAMSLFGLQSDIEIRKQLAGVSNQLAALLNQSSQQPPPPQQPPQPQHLQQPQPQWQIPSPSFPAAPSPQLYGPTISTTQYNQSSNFSAPAPAPAPAPPKSQRSQERAERRAARHQAHMNEINQQQTNMINQQQMNVMPPNPTGSPAMPGFNSYQNVQNHFSPGAGINYSYVAGNVSNVSRDDSFNVSGSGNNINFSFAR